MNTSLAPARQVEVRLGPHRYDCTYRALVMGILNRTPDSFYDRGAYYEGDGFLRRAERLVAEGADLLDVGGVKAGPGDHVSAGEELDRVVPAVATLVERFDVPVSIDTWHAEVASACFAAGAVLGNDISGFADPGYLPAAAAAGASVVATHIRLAPRVPDPAPVYEEGVVEAVEAFLAERARRAVASGIDATGVILDAGLDLGKTAAQSLELLRASDRLAALGYPLLLSASNKTFLGKLLDLEIGDRREASLAATAIGVLGGCRIVRVHDVLGTRRVVDTLAVLLGADADLAPDGPLGAADGPLGARPAP